MRQAGMAPPETTDGVRRYESQRNRREKFERWTAAVHIAVRDAPRAA